MTTWHCTKDAAGDWRAVSDDGQYRTRLKFSYQAAMHDTEINRLQRRVGNVWVDEIDGKRGRYTMPVTAADVHGPTGDPAGEEETRWAVELRELRGREK